MDKPAIWRRNGDGIEMQAWRSKPHNHEKSYSSDTSWASCRAMSSGLTCHSCKLHISNIKLKVPARAIHIYMEVPCTSYCPYTCTWKLLV